jgi:RHS repeat-associated protein
MTFAQPAMSERRGRVRQRTIVQPLEWLAPPRHDEPGNAYLNNRYHDPTLGRFVSVDPLVAQTGMPYSYGANNPVTMTDPSGLFPCFGICDLAQAAWQMTATTFVYEYDVARRYANDPGQAVKDVVTGTAFAEQTWAGINIRAGATLKRDGEYCSGAANCFVNGLSPKDATTTGHTEAYSDAKPGDAFDCSRDAARFRR